MNDFAAWNRGSSSAERSTHSTDASNRIFDALADIQPAYHGAKLRRASPIFAMGSCFAREIERALTKMGGNVISVDNRINRAEFRDAAGVVRNGFFHRFTPIAMLQEFQQAFGELPGWAKGSLLIPSGNGNVVDLNYWDVAADLSYEATMARRIIAAELVRKAAEAEVVILTLGMVESWFHKPSGLHANKVPSHVLARRRNEFEMHFVTYDETLQCLTEIKNIISRHRVSPFQMVVTVSPVPLQRTFTDVDLIISNMAAKSTLRAAADVFSRTDHVSYFPSYEMAVYSDPARAWRPDRVHVAPEMVQHIVAKFVSAYYDDSMAVVL